MMQFQIWAESIHGGVHESRNEPPATSMFGCAGGTSTSSKKSMSAAICQLASALTPKSASTVTCSVIGTAGSIIDNQSKCYKQLGELKHLYETNILSQVECTMEREAVMSTIKGLSGATQSASPTHVQSN